MESISHYLHITPALFVSSKIDCIRNKTDYHLHPLLFTLHFLDKF